jgi:hypothetical protein
MQAKLFYITYNLQPGSASLALLATGLDWKLVSEENKLRSYVAASMVTWSICILAFEMVVRKGGLDLSKAHAGATAQIEFSRRQTKAE